MTLHAHPFSPADPVVPATHDPATDPAIASVELRAARLSRAPAPRKATATRREYPLTTPQRPHAPQGRGQATLRAQRASKAGVRGECPSVSAKLSPKQTARTAPVPA